MRQFDTYKGTVGGDMIGQAMSWDRLKGIYGGLGYDAPHAGREFQDASGGLFRFVDTGDGRRKIERFGDVNSYRQNEMLTGQKAKEQDFLSRYTGAIGGQEKLGDMFGRIGGEYNLQGARNTANQLSQTLERIPEVQQQRSLSSGALTQNQLDRSIASEQSRLAPLAQRAQQQAQTATSQVQERLGYETAQQQKELLPFQQEARLLSEQIAREVTMYTQDRQNELTMLLTKLQMGQQMSLAEMQKAERLAAAETEFERSKEMYSFQLQEQLKYKPPSSGGGYDIFSDPQVQALLGGGGGQQGTYFGQQNLNNNPYEVFKGNDSVKYGGSDLNSFIYG
jgi:hypothetical protein